MNKKDIWESVLAELQLNLSKPIFSSWFSKTKVLNIKKAGNKKRIIEIAVANPFAKNTIEERYAGQIKNILDKITKKHTEPAFIVKPDAFIKSKKISKDSTPLLTVNYAKEKKIALKKAVQKIGLRPDFTFKDFAVSSTNEVAYAAAKAVAKSPGKVYHLLFLYGGVGVGKTHLMQAIGHEVLDDKYNTLIVYSTAEEFTNEIIHAIRTKSTSQFREKYRPARILLIDDVQFIGGKDTVQEEFFHTFNTIHRAGGQIVLTSDKMPDKIDGLEDRLKSRFEGGLTIDIQNPNFELRTAILLIKAQQWGKALPMDVAQLIAANIESTRKLEGFLIRLITEIDAKKQPMTPDLAKKLLGKIVVEKKEQKKTVRPKEILKAVCNYFDLKLSQIKGPKRAKDIVVPRQIAMYLLRTELEVPLMRVGEMFGGRDHTTVMHSVEKIEKEVNISESVRLDIEALKKRIYSYN
jgi:chromosomal replication initiator protein